MEELWKNIEGYDGLYQISNLGRIINRSNLIMKQKPRKDGYVRILLSKSGKYKAEYVHILVAKAFLPNIDSKPEVNHIDSDKSNNASTNLEWVTRYENHVHAVSMGLKPICPTLGKFGKDHPATKPVFQFDTNGTFIKKWDSRNEAAKFYNCTANSISRCINGNRKTCKGYVWKSDG